MPNFSFLGSIIKKKYPKVADPLNVFAWRRLGVLLPWKHLWVSEERYHELNGPPIMKINELYMDFKNLIYYIVTVDITVFLFVILSVFVCCLGRKRTSNCALIVALPNQFQSSFRSSEGTCIYIVNRKLISKYDFYSMCSSKTIPAGKFIQPYK